MFLGHYTNGLVHGVIAHVIELIRHTRLIVLMSLPCGRFSLYYEFSDFCFPTKLESKSNPNDWHFT